jgi:hypothetical protein
VINFFKVLLLPQLVVCGPSLFSYNTSFVQLFLQNLELVSQLSISPVDLWDVRDHCCVEFTLSFLFKPFLLEIIQRLLHAELNEKIA